MICSKTATGITNHEVQRRNQYCAGCYRSCPQTGSGNACQNVIPTCPQKWFQKGPQACSKKYVRFSRKCPRAWKNCVQTWPQTHDGPRRDAPTMIKNRSPRGKPPGDAYGRPCPPTQVLGLCRCRQRLGCSLWYVAEDRTAEQWIPMCLCV